MNRKLQLYEAEALIALGEVAARRQNLAAARERWEQARGTIGGAAQVGAEPEFLATWTKSLLLLGDTATARPVLDQLALMGYQTRDFEALLNDDKAVISNAAYRAAMRQRPTRHHQRRRNPLSSRILRVAELLAASTRVSQIIIRGLSNAYQNQRAMQRQRWNSYD